MENGNDDADNQELQSLKSNLVKQIENFKNEILKLYEEHEYLQMLYILRMEVESEYVKRENLKVYCDILYALVGRFRSENLNIKQEIKNEIEKLKDKAKKARPQVKEIEKNDEYGLLKLEVFSIFFLMFSFIVVSLAMIFGALIGFATLAVCVGIFAAIWGGYGLKNWYKKWRRNRNLCEISQKSQEIEEKTHKDTQISLCKRQNKAQNLVPELQNRQNSDELEK